MTRRRIIIADVRYGILDVRHLPHEEECVLLAPFSVEWTANRKQRCLTVPAGSHFWPGVPRMPFAARLFLKLIGITKMFPASCAHDELYYYQGGKKPGLFLTDEAGVQVVIRRREADLLAFHLSRAEQVRPFAARIIRFSLRHFGRDVWIN